MSEPRQPVIVGGARTPVGSLLGSLASKSASELGGIAIAAAAWRMLNAPDDEPPKSGEEVAADFDSRKASRMAFYPLTMPITTGPGTISVAVSLGTNRPNGQGASRTPLYSVGRYAPFVRPRRE